MIGRFLSSISRTVRLGPMRGVLSSDMLGSVMRLPLFLVSREATG